MDDEQLEAWLRQREYDEETRSLIRQIRLSSPSRCVGGGYANVPSIYPSDLTGETRQAESHRAELAGIYEMEWKRDGDDAVLDYYDQPPPFRIRFQDAESRNVATDHTSDYFVLRKSTAGWEEWATEQELIGLHEKYPARYYKDEAGTWHDTAGEEYANKYHLYYAVRSTAEINWVYIRNVQFLEDYLRKGCPPVPSERRELIRAYVAARQGITLEELIALAERQATRDDIFTLIAQSDIYVDLGAAPLTEPSHVHIFSAKELAPVVDYRARKVLPSFSLATVRTGCTLNWDSRLWKVINVGESKVSLLSDDGHILQFLLEQIESLICQGQILVASPDEDTNAALRDMRDVNPRDLTKATRDCYLINNYLQNGALPSHVEMPQRTFFRKLAQYRDAEQSYGDGFLGLVPKYRVGPFTPGMSEETRKLMMDFIENDYESLKQKSKLASWRQLKLSAETKGIPHPSYRVYCAAIDQRPIPEQVMKRQGTRARYQVDTFYWELDLTTPRHGDRPFEIVHIDHTELDIRLRASNNQEFSERPWLTLLTDAFSRRVLAFYLTFDKPSHRSCMMVIRECVRRFHRFGQIVVLDYGKEFQNKYLDFLVVRKLKATKKTRPAAKPRGGTVIERMFGVTNTEFIHNLLGSTKIMRNVRQVTKAVNPEEHKTWTLPDLYERLKEYFYEVRDNLVHPALGYKETPHQAFDRGLLQGGLRLHRIIVPDRKFLMLTMPTTQKGDAKVVPSRGVKINHIFYWCDAFREPHVRGKRVPVRYDPFDAGVAYAFVDGQWRDCISQYYPVFKGHSLQEVFLATEELRQRNRYAAQATFTVNARLLAEFMQSVEGQEKLLVQRIKDMEGRDIRRSCVAGMAEPAPEARSSEFAAAQGEAETEDEAAVLKTYGTF